MDYEKHLVSESKAVEIENFIRSSFIDTGNVTREEVFNATVGSVAGVDKGIFMNVWSNLVADELFVKVSDDSYRRKI